MNSVLGCYRLVLKLNPKSDRGSYKKETFLTALRKLTGFQSNRLRASVLFFPCVYEGEEEAVTARWDTRGRGGHEEAGAAG